MIAILLAGAMLAAPSLAAQQAPPFEIGIGAVAGTAGGWVQVREHQVAGTRLDFRRDLGVRSSSTAIVGFGLRLNPHTELRLRIESYAVDGSATLPRDTYFNGATLAGGTSLVTGTHFPYFVRFTAQARHRLGTALGADVAGSAGITFVSLTFQLHGALAPGSASTETKEAFISQELPVPLLGLDARWPVARRLAVVASAEGGFLPNVYSLRHEGGRVTMSQGHADLAAGLRWSAATWLSAEAAWTWTGFAQEEHSTEDGNQVRFTQQGLRLGIRAVP